jgi:hypothetical protein
VNLRFEHGDQLLSVLDILLHTHMNSQIKIDLCNFKLLILKSIYTVQFNYYFFIFSCELKNSSIPQLE